MNSHYIIKTLCVFFLLIISCKPKKAKEILYTENFEQYADNKMGNWLIEGNVTLDSQKAFSGKQSLKLTAGEGYQNRAFIHFNDIFPLAENTFYGSMMLYINEAPPNNIHWTMIQGSGNIKNTNYSAEVRYGGQHQKQLMANYDTKGTKSDCWQHSNFKIPEKEWTKYQWYFNGRTNTMKLWVNDSLINSLVVKEKGSGCIENELKNLWVFPEFDTITLGWVDYEKGGGKKEIWLDDISFWTE